MTHAVAADPSYDFLRHDLAFLLAENEKKPVKPPKGTISEWVQGFRVLPANTPFPGFWDNDKTPYLVEPSDNMAPFSPVLITSVMKGVQLGLTAAAENVIAYWMLPQPAEVLYVSATDELLEKWSTKRLEPLIDSIGMRDKITAQLDPAKAKTSRRSGDKVLSKEYPGGTLNMASAQSAAGLRSDSKRVLVLDEVDGAPRMLKTGEGNWLDVAYGRTAAWGARAKIMEFSTPTTFEESLIRERYEKGDQRKFHVPCVHCGVMQVLEFKQLKWEMKDGVLHKVWYECPHCAGHMFNHHKTVMLRAGEWIPTAKATTVGHRSYHISSLYSPVGMLTWYKMVEKYLEAQMTPGGMRSFQNLYLGMPYKDDGYRPKIEKVLALRGDYMDGKDVPEGVLFVTAGVDVQAGSGWDHKENKPKDPKNPPRLEMEIVGHGAQFRTWSLAYLKFEGPITDPHAGAWEAMDQWARGGGLVRKRSDGVEFPVNMVLIDSGDGNITDLVYVFTTRWKNTFPSKGFNALKRRDKENKEKGDEAGPSNFKRYRAARIERTGEMTLYEISTNYYKSWTYTNLNIQRQDIDPQRPGFCAFPSDRDEKFFDMLTAEEKRSDGTFYAGGRRNEALDCRVMALCASDVFLDAKVAGYRAAAKSQGRSDLEIQRLDHVFVLEVLKKQTARRIMS